MAERWQPSCRTRHEHPEQDEVSDLQSKWDLPSPDNRVNQAARYTDAGKTETENTPAGRDLLSAGVTIGFTKMAQLKHRAKCAHVKGADTHTPLGRLDKTAMGFPLGRAELRVWLSRTGQCHPAERSGSQELSNDALSRGEGRQRPGHCPDCSPNTQGAQPWHSCSLCSPISLPRLCYRCVPRGHVWDCYKTRAHWHYKCPQSVLYMQLFNEACCHYSKMIRGLS